MRYEPPLYSKRPSAAKRAKRAKKILSKLAFSDPLIKSLIHQKAMQLAKASKPKRQSYPQAPIYTPGMGADFYSTRAWRDIRYQVFVRHGKICQCCGQTQGPLHVDHILPRSRYPEKELDIENLQILCEACNLGKSARDTTDWRQTR